MSAILRWIGALCVPFLIACVVTTAVIQPWYPTWEYGKANFPEDTFGWTQDERLDLAMVSVDFLRSWGSADDTIYMLEEQTMPDSDELLFTENEVLHMYDVKVRTNIIRWLILALGAIVLLGLAVSGTAVKRWRMMRQGGILAILLLIGIGIFFLAAWDTFFTQFHEILFPAGNWSFPYSSSLIRLFPNKFWFDVGAIIVGGTFGTGLLLTLFASRRLGRLSRKTY